MRAVRFHGREKVSVEEVPLPPLVPGEVLVRVTRAALCGSELGALRAAREHSIGTGHEAVGFIADAADTGLVPGQRVALLAVLGCGDCSACARGAFPHCAQARGMAPSHAEYVAIPARNCLPLPDDLDDDTAIAVFGCGIGVAYHGCRRIAAAPGEVILVAGAGPIGLAAVLVLRHLGARPVVADLHPYRLALAQRLGAEALLRPGEEDLDRKLRDLTGGRLADKSFLASGSADAALLALQHVEPEGVVAAVGVVHDLRLDTFRQLAMRDRALIGSWHYHRDEFEPLLNLVRAGLPAASIITHSFTLDEAPEAYRQFTAGQTGKAVLRI